MVKISKFGFVIPEMNNGNNSKISYPEREKYIQLEKEEYERLKHIEELETEQVHLRVKKQILKLLKYFFYYGNMQDRINDGLLYTIRMKKEIEEIRKIRDKLYVDVENTNKAYFENPTIDNENVSTEKLKRIRYLYNRDISTEIDIILDDF